MTTETGCDRCCGDPIDLTTPHVTVMRQVEHWDGDLCRVHRCTEIAAYHPGCAPTADDLHTLTRSAPMHTPTRPRDPWDELLAASRVVATNVAARGVATPVPPLVVSRLVAAVRALDTHPAARVPTASGEPA